MGREVALGEQWIQLNEQLSAKAELNELRRDLPERKQYIRMALFIKTLISENVTIAKLA
ncbi:hypothetical protein JHK84_029078 [Glycine max]|nr:hypothetical protein JHK87_028744 [Glycine soja]KAG5152606.1 hypothetical protein JHK84_029078 [Glycine max]